MVYQKQAQRERLGYKMNEEDKDLKSAVEEIDLAFIHLHSDIRTTLNMVDHKNPRWRNELIKIVNTQLSLIENLYELFSKTLGLDKKK